MATDRARTIKGISDQTRAAARAAAAAAGLSLDAWIDRALAQAAEAARHPDPPPGATRAEVAEVVREALSEPLTSIADRIDRLTARLASLEERVRRTPQPEAPREEAAAPSPIEAMQARMRRRRGL